MTNAEKFFEKLKASNKIISTKSVDERRDVILIIDDIISDFKKLNRLDYRNDLSYKSKPLLLKSLNDEKQLLENFNDIEHISDSYNWTKLCLAGVGVFFQPM